ncbi:hypothetical protein [Aureispira anguillae]|uniref:Uncharacterized protein n=1 Tax=Aureispira anguillae TaxID=2864201 RepID=A0A915YFD7_9BACT|nr:hypothetical protein [Aureispira anguillae]BDS12019.1 hypothetical protein AsAng_0027340 [Aureispira anguillae]
MMQSFFKIIVLIGGLLMGVNSDAQKVIHPIKNNIRQVNQVNYELLSGLAEITSIKRIKTAKESPLGYDEYQVLFRFVPMEGQHLLQILEDKELEFKLSYRSSAVCVGPAYIKKMRLKVGTRYAMDLFQTRSGGLGVKRYFYQSKALEHRLFEAYEDIVDLLGEIISFDPIDSMLVNLEAVTLTGAEQRALMDAELKHGLKNKTLVKAQLTKTAIAFLKRHRILLEEYEAAIRVLAKMEEKVYQQQVLKEEQEKKAAALLKAKIEAMKTASLPKVVNETKIFRGCYYEVVPGLAEIVAIHKIKTADESMWGYDEYQVLFHFIPAEGHDLLTALRDTTLEFLLYSRGDKIRVGPAYLEQKSVCIGTRYAMTLYQKRDAQICTERYAYESKILSNDLFEVFPPEDTKKRTRFQQSLLKEKDHETTQSLDTTKDKTKERKGNSPLLEVEMAQEKLKEAQENKKLWRKRTLKAIRVARKNLRTAKQANPSKKK